MRALLSLTFTDKFDLRRGENIIALSNLSIYYSWKNIKSSYNNNKFKISVPTWNDEFELPDGLYSVSNIQDYFEHILKKHEKNIENPSVKIYVNKMVNRITTGIKNWCSLEILIPGKKKKKEITEKHWK